MSVSKFYKSAIQKLATLPGQSQSALKFLSVSNMRDVCTLGLWELQSEIDFLHEPNLLSTTSFSKNVADIQSMAHKMCIVDVDAGLHLFSMTCDNAHWNLAEVAQESHHVPVNIPGHCLCSSQLPKSDDRLLVGTDAGQAAVVNLSFGNVEQILTDGSSKNTPGPLTSLTALSDSVYLGGSFNGQIHLWDARVGSVGVKSAFVYPQKTCSVLSVSSHSGQPHLAAFGLSTGTVSLWDLRKWPDSIASTTANSLPGGGDTTSLRPAASLCHLTTPDTGPIWQVDFNCHTTLGGKHSAGCLIISSDELGLLLYQSEDWSERSLSKEEHELELLLEGAHLRSFTMKDNVILAASRTCYLHAIQYAF